MTSPRFDPSKIVPATENCMEFGAKKLEESDPEVLAAAAVLFGLQFLESRKASLCELCPPEPKKKRPRMTTRKESVEALNRSIKNQRKRKFRDSSGMILDEECGMPVGEVPGWLEAMVRELGGSEVRLVVQKKLFESDVTSGQSRFSIPMGKIVQSFLTGGESALLDNGHKIEVSLIQPCGKTSELLLGKWRLTSSSSYVLTKNWTSVWKEPRNCLEKGMEVQLWSYRIKGKLCFWLVNMSATDDNSV
ncbi:hypothetical protein MLD38_005109 [Melastoma candidum]|uniref:Uncharacterized protein n=1 Tax=Melastoma candidum TaxID=119954 RepID=A0ACB9S7U5_9MYRT|nr:hypothetical protein MLD38_005109 [Melastoma candidum]